MIDAISRVFHCFAHEEGIKFKKKNHTVELVNGEHRQMISSEKQTCKEE